MNKKERQELSEVRDELAAAALPHQVDDTGGWWNIRELVRVVQWSIKVLDRLLRRKA